MGTVSTIGRKRGRPPGSGSRGNEGKNQTLSRALLLLQRLAETPSGVSLSDLSLQLGMPSATVHRLLNTFEDYDFVEHDEALGLWFVGVQAFVVGNAFVNRRDFVASAKPYMRELMERCGETVNLGIIDDGEAVFISQVESQEMMRMVVNLGSRSPVHASGVGKAILAHGNDSDLTAILEKRGLARFTDRTIDTPSGLRAELQRIREQGYSLDDEEHAIGLRCVAAPVFDEAGKAICAISLSGPTARIGDERLGELGWAVRQTAEQITQTLGGLIPTS